MAGDITTLLRAYDEGKRQAFDAIVDLVYGDLRRLARQQLRNRRPGDTLDTTGLVNEAYLKLVDHSVAGIRDRGHFFAICARAMRQILVDHARARTRLKRGGASPDLPFAEDALGLETQVDEVLAVDQALARLEEKSDRLVQVVECRYFAGFTEGETATALGVSERTVHRDWLKARAWLHTELAGEAAS